MAYMDPMGWIDFWSFRGFVSLWWESARFQQLSNQFPKNHHKWVGIEIVPTCYKVVPQFVSVQLFISTISLGLMNGGCIYSIHGDYKPANITGGGTTL